VNFIKKKKNNAILEEISEDKFIHKNFKIVDLITFLNKRQNNSLKQLKNVK
jgi:hypothetical protein